MACPRPPSVGALAAQLIFSRTTLAMTSTTMAVIDGQDIVRTTLRHPADGSLEVDVINLGATIVSVRAPDAAWICMPRNSAPS